MQYHIAKNGEKSGPFDQAEVHRRLVAGELSGSDLGWREGMAQWEPLSKLIPPPNAGAVPVFDSVPPTVAAAPPSSGLAIASMVCGILSLFTVGLTSLPAIITGHMARSRIKHRGAGGSGLALTGLITGYVGLVIMMIAVFAIGSISLLTSQVDIAKETRTQSDLQALSIALQSYELRALKLPTTEQGLNVLVNKPTIEPIPASWRALLKEVPKDPWGNEYRYRTPAQKSQKGYDLYSVGRDGQDGTADDIGNWKS